MAVEETVLAILEDLTGSEEVKDLDLPLFEEGLLDSLATVQLLVEIEDQLEVSVPVSEFERPKWGTPRQIIAQVNALKA